MIPPTVTKPKSNILLFVLAMTLLFLLPTAMADPEQYLMPGVSRDSTYVQDGTGVWTGRSAVTYLSLIHI